MSGRPDSRLLACLAAALAFDARAADLHVSPAGDDGNDCSLAAPCRTIQHAIDVAADGDVVHAAAGTYVESLVVARDVAVAGEGPDATVIDGGGVGVIDVPASTRARLSGLAVTGGNRFDGGGILNSGDLELESVAVRGNQGTRGAGIQNLGRLTLSGCAIDGNGGSLNGGGGIFNWGGRLEIRSSTLSRNRGDLVNPPSSTPAILNGGGGEVILVNSTVSGNWGNEAGVSYGAAVENLEGSVTLYNCTIAGNHGGGVVGVVRLGNTILAGNTIGDCHLGEIVSEGHNLLGEVGSCPVTGDLTGNRLGVDPLLGVLGQNGGPTETMAPAASSPAIDAGDPSGCVADEEGQPLVVDQRGYPRPADCGGGLRCDIGAVEGCGPAPDMVLYESTDPSSVAATSNAVGVVTVSPHEHSPAAAPLLFYQLDDGTGSPAGIDLTSTGAAVRIHSR